MYLQETIESCQGFGWYEEKKRNFVIQNYKNNVFYRQIIMNFFLLTEKTKIQ